MLHCRRFGEGRALVLLHGFLGGSGYWAPQISHFARMFEVIAPDLPGFAGSHAQPTPDTISGFAPVLLDFLDRISIGRFALVGHSLGGMVAQQIALDFPDRVERLVLYGTASAGRLPGRFETQEASIARILSEGIEAHAEVTTQSWFVYGKDNPFYEMCHESGVGLSADDAVRVLKAGAQWNVTSRLRELSTPTLVICGDRDRSCSPEESIKLWHAIPDSRLCIVPSCAHCVHLEKADIFNGIVADFLLSSL